MCPRQVESKWGVLEQNIEPASCGELSDMITRVIDNKFEALVLLEEWICKIVFIYLYNTLVFL